MRKFLCILITTSMLFLSNVKPANANIVFDLTEIVSEISEIVGKITDAAGKITNSVNMVKQTLTQGFSKEVLMGLVKNVAGKYVKGFIASKFKEKIVKATDEKNQEIYEEDVKNYKEALTTDFEAKEGETKEQLNNIIMEITKMEGKISAQRLVVKAAKEACDRAIIGRKKLCEKYHKEEAKLVEMGLILSNLKGRKNELQKVKSKIAEEKANIDNDAKLQLLNERVENIEKEKAEKEERDKQQEEIQENLIEKAKDENTRWDDQESIQDFEVKEEDYKLFLETYFYRTNESAEENSNMMNEIQGKRDAIERSRRQLLMNTAAHLMQVTATLREDVTHRRIIVKEYTDTVVKGEGETESISAYSATKIEYARALLLYAKMQTAKLQYLSAKEVIDLDEDKYFEDYKTYLHNDLNRWLLSKETIERATIFNRTRKSEVEGEVN